MILSGREIEKEINHNIIIKPYNKDQLNPNSYNLKLHDELVVYDEVVLDMKKDNKTKTIKIPPEGLVLKPGKLYLGRTVEYTETYKYAPMLEGRSSIGRLGMFVHITAGFGDVGFKGYWTLEIVVTEPIRIYPGVEVCQLYYHEMKGDAKEYNSSKYQENKGIQSSKLYKELREEE